MVLLNASGAVSIPLWASIPFVVMLLTIALGPLFFSHWWDKNRNKFIVSGVLSVITAIYLFVALDLDGALERLEHQVLGDYVPFIILLTALFAVTGGINLSGDIKAKPAVNTLFLGIGFVLASIMGTTGAAMLLIRPLIKTNEQRQFKMHTILFFIAAVANCGGLLTPLGDPPLLMLYLRGAEFTWFLNLIPEWAFTGAMLLIIYYLVDRHFYKKEPWTALSADAREVQPLKVTGIVNIIYLLLIVLAVAFVNQTFIPEMGEENPPIWLRFLREIILIVVILLSVFTTKKEVRQSNNFTWGPIIEVAVVFIGIFITMAPTMIYLNEHASKMGLTEPWHFYYCAGALSSFLDNAPTAIAFHGVAAGLDISREAAAAGIVNGVFEGTTFVAGIPEILLKAVAIGSVFFGSMTYIGNGPNFMIKSIAEESGIKMPSFFGYMIKFSLIVLLPIYILTQLLFLH